MNQGLKLTRFVNWNICLSRIMRFFSFYYLTSTCSVAQWNFQAVQRTLKMYIWSCIQEKGESKLIGRYQTVTITREKLRNCLFFWLGLIVSPSFKVWEQQIDRNCKLQFCYLKMESVFTSGCSTCVSLVCIHLCKY